MPICILLSKRIAMISVAPSIVQYLSALRGIVIDYPVLWISIIDMYDRKANLKIRGWTEVFFFKNVLPGTEQSTLLNKEGFVWTHKPR